MDINQTKSKDRVSKFGEVYTPANIVKDMLDLIKKESYEIDRTVLEPSCGTGRFLVEVLNRKLQICNSLQDVIKSVSTIYGIDIIPDNIRESKEIMLKQIDRVRTKFNIKDTEYEVIKYIIDCNIVLGDTLKGVKLKTISNRNTSINTAVAQPTIEDGALTMIEWRFNSDNSVELIEFSLNQPDLELSHKKLNSIYEIINSNTTDNISDEYDYDDFL